MSFCGIKQDFFEATRIFQEDLVSQGKKYLLRKYYLTKFDYCDTVSLSMIIFISSHHVNWIKIVDYLKITANISGPSIIFVSSSCIVSPITWYLY